MRAVYECKRLGAVHWYRVDHAVWSGRATVRLTTLGGTFEVNLRALSSRPLGGDFELCYRPDRQGD